MQDVRKSKAYAIVVSFLRKSKESDFFVKKILNKYTFFLFTIIPLGLYSMFYVFSVISGVNYSFTDWNGISQGYGYIGFKNYSNLLQNPFFWQSLGVTLSYALLLVGGVIVVSLVLSLSLNSIKRMKTFTKSVFFVPAMIGGVTIAMIWDQIFYRVIPVIGQALGIDILSQNPLGLPSTAIFAVVFVNIWQAAAMPTVIFIAGLQSIPEDLYESAMLDGASTFKRFRYITLPYLIPTITVNLVLVIKSGFTVFDYPFVLTGGGPVRSTTVIGVMIYNDAFQNMKFSLANAEACVLFVIIAALSILQIKLSSKRGVNGI